MSLKLSKNNTTISFQDGGSEKHTWLSRLVSSVAHNWEAYLIVLVAGFLRFYQINTTELDEDQAMLFRMAYDAVHHGLLPTTSNAASIGIANPPGVIYLLMPIAAVTANPLWGAVLVGAFTTATALLTYLFTRRYYGRFAGVLAALLYATAARPLNYARFIWQPNLMPPFVVLFLFALFWGVVERRKGWLFPALLLFGVLYQMHPTTLLLAAPLLVALVLAPGTLRWRDLALAVISLLVIFFPYLVWEMFTGFADIHTVLSLAKQHAHINTQALHFYRVFLQPFDQPSTDVHSVLRMISPEISWLSVVVPLLTLAGFATASLLLLLSDDKQPDTVDTGDEQAKEEQQTGLLVLLRNWWTQLRANPYKCGLIVLLAWQVVPLAILSRHSISLHSQYFFMFMPGPFILIGLVLAKLVEWLRGQQARWHGVRYAVYALAALVIIAQFVGSTAAIIDTSSGNFNDRAFQPYPYHNDLQSLQRALSEADHLAQQRHLSHVYITTDYATQTAMRYLSEQMQTPATLFDASDCLVLPNPADGPAALLVGPYDDLTNALLGQFATATLVDQPARPGGAPFRLYVVSSTSEQPSSQDTFTGNLQLLDRQAEPLTVDGKSWLVTSWSLLHPQQPKFRTTYNYALTMIPNGDTQEAIHSTCTFTAIRPGDRLLAAFALPKENPLSVSATIQAQSFTTIPNNPVYGPFHLETDSYQNVDKTALQTTDGRDSVSVAAL